MQLLLKYAILTYIAYSDTVLPEHVHAVYVYIYIYSLFILNNIFYINFVNEFSLKFMMSYYIFQLYIRISYFLLCSPRWLLM